MIIESYYYPGQPLRTYDGRTVSDECRPGRVSELTTDWSTLTVAQRAVLQRENDHYRLLHFRALLDALRAEHARLDRHG